ncbi:MAG: nucleoside hydrolase [Candidatus Thermoplasmatota archaeon]|uniref:nucleoside hydrolase n=2 Tax=Ferroplasma TaxID=74968 RepID=UPI00260D94C2|nr:nucleoside hydrolase [Ferroplasma sp.]MCL4311210.1 nucleoside hydrolase [Candidatus Thermoplasmatota archaeon]
MGKLILNVDTGIDDAFAMILLNKYRIFPEFIVAASGNSTLENTYRNTTGITNLLQLGCPVYPGSYKPLVRHHYLEDFHGENGIGCYEFDEVSLENQPNGIIKMYEALQHDKYTIICTSPMTSLGLLLSMNSGIKKNIENIVIMGGAFGITQYGNGNMGNSEFNVFYDPEAAKIVLGADINETIISLDLTMNPELAIKNLPQNTGRTALDNFIYKTTEFMLKKHGTFELHDPIAALSFINPDIFEFVNGSIDVDSNGVTRFKKHRNSKKRIAVALNNEDYINQLVNKIYDIA